MAAEKNGNKKAEIVSVNLTFDVLLGSTHEAEEFTGFVMLPGDT